MRLNARLILLLATCSVAGVTLAPRPAVAQEAQMRTLLDSARDNYDNLELDAATAKIDEALALAAERDVTRGAALADLYIMRGVIAYGATGDEAAVRESFIAAVTASRNAEVPRNYATPDLERLLGEARDAVPDERPTTPSGVLSHSPLTNVPAEQPVVFDATVPPDLGADAVQVFFRVAGEENWKRVQLQRVSPDRYAVQVAASEFSASTFNYFILAVDGAGQTVGNSGSEASPHNVTVIGRDTVAPPPPIEGGTPTEKRTVMYVGLTGGTSPGLLTGAANNQPTAHPTRDVSAGLAMAFGHAELGLGATLTNDMHLGLFFRFQFAPSQSFEGLSDTTTGSGSGFWDTKKECLGLGLPGDCILGLKYKLFINDSSKVRAYATMGTGVGRVRNWLRLKQNAADGNLCNGKTVHNGTTSSGQAAQFCYIRDTVRTGWFHVGAGGGLAISVNDFTDLVLDTYLMILAPATSVNLDLNGGFVFRF